MIVIPSGPLRYRIARRFRLAQAVGVCVSKKGHGAPTVQLQVLCFRMFDGWGDFRDVMALAERAQTFDASTQHGSLRPDLTRNIQSGQLVVILQVRHRGKWIDYRLLPAELNNRFDGYAARQS